MQGGDMAAEIGSGRFTQRLSSDRYLPGLPREFCRELLRAFEI